MRVGGGSMTEREKLQQIGVAYNIIKKIMTDTDEDLWACKYLEDALADLECYFEESEF